METSTYTIQSIAKSQGPASTNEKEPGVKDLRDPIPKSCFKPSLLISLAYLTRELAYASILVYYALYIPSLPTPYLRALTWGIYGFCQGCVGTGLWILAHEYNHGAFSVYPQFNDLIGWTVHSALLVPYFSWKITHARHHRYTEHIEKDMMFMPYTEDEYAARIQAQIESITGLAEDAPLITLPPLVLHLLLEWPTYLLFCVTAGREGTSKDEQPTRRRSFSYLDPSGSSFRIPSSAMSFSRM